jgi:ring-1,2-phenylacetyl-CoA epoxidase subunit PaaD
VVNTFAASASDASAKVALLARIWAALDSLSDPEIPVVTLREMGILRDVVWQNDGVLAVVITPTYSGCPAMGQIEDDVRTTLATLGVNARVQTQLAPAWTTAPPARCGANSDTDAASTVVQFASRANKPEVVPCPHCGSHDTTETSHFGSTACKALYKCLSCMEPFDYFKPY